MRTLNAGIIYAMITLTGAALAQEDPYPIHSSFNLHEIVRMTEENLCKASAIPASRGRNLTVEGRIDEAIDAYRTANNFCEGRYDQEIKALTKQLNR